MKSDERFEFIKDLTSLANTYGGDGYLIVGYDDKAKSFIDSNLSTSGKTDILLYDIIRKTVDRPFNFDVHDFEFESHKLCVIHILPSLDKPHVIRNYVKGNSNYPNEIFIRRSSGNDRASKPDLDLMYAEKNLIIVERDVRVSIVKESTQVDFFPANPYVSDARQQQYKLYFRLDLIFHNRGIEQLYVIKSEMTLDTLIKTEESVIGVTLDLVCIHSFALSPQNIWRPATQLNFESKSSMFETEINAVATTTRELIKGRGNALKFSKFVLHLSDGSTFRAPTITTLDNISPAR